LPAFEARTVEPTATVGIGLLHLLAHFEARAFAVVATAPTFVMRLLVLLVSLGPVVVVLVVLPGFGDRGRSRRARK
jgi:hypothetical protein